MFVRVSEKPSWFCFPQARWLDVLSLVICKGWGWSVSRKFMQCELNSRRVFQNGNEFKSLTGDTDWDSQSGGGVASRGLRTPREWVMPMGLHWTAAIVTDVWVSHKHTGTKMDALSQFGCSPAWQASGMLIHGGEVGSWRKGESLTPTLHWNWKTLSVSRMTRVKPSMAKEKAGARENQK